MKSSPSHVSNFFVSTALRSWIRPLYASGKLPHKRATRSAGSIANGDSAQSTGPPATFFQPNQKNGKSSRPISPGNEEVDVLAALLDPYLPLELRSKTWLENLAHFEGIRSIDKVPSLLFEAQLCKSLQQDLLSYIGLRQNRWDALLWLIKSLLTNREPSPVKLGDRPLYRAPSDLEWSIDQFAYYPDLVVKHLLRDLQDAFPSSIEQATESYKRQSKGEIIDSFRDPIGQIWQCVACLVLEATESSIERSSEIMNYVYQIIAYMHHCDIISPTLYNWKYPKDRSAVQRPPTLHLLSARIMTTLSDAAWKAYEKNVLPEAAQVGAEYSYKIFELPTAVYDPRIRPLSMGIWLDLVLWSCVEGGWILEAAWIVNQILQRDSKPAWSVVSWDTLQNAASSEWEKDGGVDWDSPMARFNGVAGSLEGYNEGLPLVDMGTRRISSEVIEALMDGIVNNLNNTVEEKAVVGIATILRYIYKCKRLLERGKVTPRSMSWQSIILRLIESGRLSPESAPRILESVTELEPSHNFSLGSTEKNQSAIGLGRLHLALLSYIRLGFVDAAMRTFRTIQNAMNPQRTRSMPSISRDPLQKGSRTSIHLMMDESLERRVDPSLCPPIPEVILASYLDLVTNVGRHDVGHWLIYPETIYEPVIPLTLYASEHMQPALLRYATATSDEGLLVQVTERLHPSFSLPIVHALLQCQLTLEKWDAVEDLLYFIKSRFSCGVSDSDIMMTAKIIVLISTRNDQSQSYRDDIIKAQRILQNMLQGAYDGDPDPSCGRDYSRLRLLNQISRILASTPTCIASIAAAFVRSEGRAHSTTSVSVEAFNILLEGIVEAHGAPAGKELWDRWCRLPISGDQDLHINKATENALAISTDRSGLEEIQIPIVRDDSLDETIQEKVVMPTLQTVRIIISPIVKAYKIELSEKNPAVTRVSTVAAGQAHERSTAEVQILDWAIARYQELGMKDQEIDREVPRPLNGVDAFDDGVCVISPDRI